MKDTNYSFNYVRNRDKLFANLISIIDGIMADGVIRDEEVLYLDTWLLEANSIIKNGIIRGISARVSDILADGLVTNKERDELKNDLIKIQKEILDIPDINLNSTDVDIHLLNGLCKGIISDRSINDAEVKYLNWWLAKNSALKTNYPGKELYSLVKEILSDGIVTVEESQALYHALVDFTGCDLDCGIVDGLATRLPIDADARVTFDKKTYCLSGVFVTGKRSVVERMIKGAGGTIAKNVTRNLNFLVIGTLSSCDWKFSSYGGKIEKAIDYRDNKGDKIKIISEEMLLNALPCSC